MTTKTNAVVATYLDNLKQRYPWASNPATADKGLALAEKSARAALNGLLKLEGEAWTDALKTHGFKGPQTKATVAAFAREAR